MALEFVHPDQTGISSTLRGILDRASATLGRTIRILSGHRSEAYNASVGGANQSYHITGNAADIDMSGMSAQQRSELVTALGQAGAGGFITYSNSPNMLHVDTRSSTHFMYDKTAALIQNAPQWFRNLAAKYEGVGMQGTAGQGFSTSIGSNEGPLKIYVPANPLNGDGTVMTPSGQIINSSGSRATDLLNSLFGTGPLSDGTYTDGQGNPVTASQTGGVNDAIGGLGGFMSDWFGRIVFTVAGLIVLIFGIYLIAKSPNTIAIPVSSS